MNNHELENRIKELEAELIEEKRQTQSRKEGETKFQSIADNIDSHIAYVNAETLKYEFVNDLFEKSFGIPKEKIIGSHIKDIIGETNYKFALKYINEVKLGKSCSYENSFNITSGKRWIQVNYSPVFDDNNKKVVGIAVVSNDITERKQTEKSLQESEERFQLLFNKAPLGYQSLDIDGNFIEVNQQWLDTLGYTREEVIGKWFGDFMTLSSQNQVQKKFPEFIANGKVQTEFEMVHKNGSIIMIAFDGRIGYDKNGEFKQTHCILKDITEDKKWKDAIKKSESKHSAMISNISDVIGIIGADGLMKYKSSNVEKWFGWKPQDLIGTDGFSNVHPDDLERIQKEFFTILEKENSTNTLEFRYKCKDGSYKPIELTAKNLSNDPIIEGVLLNYHDITERKKTEDSLIKLKAAVEKLEVSIVITDKNGNIEYANPFFSKLTGYTTDEYIGNNPRILKTDYHPQAFYKDMWSAITSGKTWESEFYNQKKNGEFYWEYSIISPIQNKNNVITHYVAVKTDITERKQSEQELKQTKEKAEESEERYRNLVEAASDAIYLTEEDGTIIDTNQSALDISGKSREEIVGHNIDTVDVNFPANEFVKFWKKYPINTQKIFETTHQHKNGDLIPVEISSKKYKLNNRIYLLGIARDITERKHADKLLRSSQEMLLSSQSVANICSYSTNLKPTEINASYWECSPEFYKIFGIDETYPHTIEGWIGFLHPEYRKDVAAYHESVVLEKKSFNREYKIIRINDGVERWVHGTGELVYDEKGNPIRMYGAIQDITERKQVELALKKSEGYLEKAQTVSQTGHYIWDLGKSILTWSNEMFNIYGLKQENGTPTPEEYINFVHEDDKYILSPENMEMIIQKPYHELQYKIIDQSTNDVKHIYLWGETIFNKTGEPVRVIGVIQDITKQKNTEFELIKAKEKAEESDRLKSAFLTNMSHEIRTPMNSILGFAKLLKNPNLSSEKQNRFIEVIGQSGERMLETINNIVDISKIEAGIVKVNIQEANINGEMEFSYELFNPLAEKKGIQLSFKNGLPLNESKVNTDKEKVYGIMTNLLRNAIKFTSEGSIKFGYEKKGQYLEFYVKDTGIGLSEQHKEIIFERFRQGMESHTRGYEGSGLGLSISKSYVEMLGGKLWVESQEGLGSTFYFTIPYSTVSNDKNVIENTVSEKNEEIGIKNLKILIVEDDEASTLFITEALQAISHKIIHAKTGVEAIEACRNNPGLDLILMDIKMPEVDGYEATRQIRLFNTDIIIIAQTAHAMAVDRKMAIEAGCNDYISKPVDMSLLMEIIKKHYI